MPGLMGIIEALLSGWIVLDCSGEDRKCVSCFGGVGGGGGDEEWCRTDFLVVLLSSCEGEKHKSRNTALLSVAYVPTRKRVLKEGSRAQQTFPRLFSSWWRKHVLLRP